MWQEQLEDLRRRASRARREVKLIAPYIKTTTFSVLLDAIPPKVECNVFARWTVRDVVSGATDISIWPLVKERNNAGNPTSLWIVDSLHAKYYRFDETILIGSANLTARGMKQGPSPNLEILVPYSLPDSKRDYFESEVNAAARPVTQEVYEYWLTACGDLVPPEPRTLEEQAQWSGTWFPQSRNPKDIAMILATPHYPQIPKSVAMSDVTFLRVPPGFGIEKSLELLSLAFSESDIVHRIRNWIGRDRRFGEVKRWVGHNYPNERDPSVATQTLYRWLTDLLPNEFSMEVANHSEILSRRPQGTSTR